MRNNLKLPVSADRGGGTETDSVGVRRAEGNTRSMTVTVVVIVPMPVVVWALGTATRGGQAPTTIPYGSAHSQLGIIEFESERGALVDDGGGDGEPSSGHGEPFAALFKLDTWLRLRFEGVDTRTHACVSHC